MTEFKTKQEELWAGDFGNEYVDRNNDPATMPGRINMYSKILRSTSRIDSVLELGCNIGMNLDALHTLLPNAQFDAVEINDKAYEIARQKEWATIRKESLLSSTLNIKADLVLIAGVLIHINPDALKDAYETLYRCASKYIVLVEYYNPTPMTLSYRGHDERLYKRDFAGEMLDRYSDLVLVDYGFAYHRDTHFPVDDSSWFLLEKR